jgi:tartrate dehydrogenase/decarboxylase/D-malate dehydrogenase
MLEHLGHVAAADRVMRAVTLTLAEPMTRTRELGGRATTSEVVTACLSALA